MRKMKPTVRPSKLAGYTGDLERFKKSGYFTFVDRFKDMIISGAENLYTEEIEGVISRHPGVMEVAVFGISSEVYGASVCAPVVRNLDHGFSQEEIMNYCALRLSGYKKLKKVLFVDDLPKNTGGKVTKTILRDPFWAESKPYI